MKDCGCVAPRTLSGGDSSAEDLVLAVGRIEDSGWEYVHVKDLAVLQSFLSKA